MTQHGKNRQNHAKSNKYEYLGKLESWILASGLILELHPTTCREYKINVDNPASLQSASANCQGKYDACSIPQKLTPNL
jgi:hypothetical protein